MLAGKADKHTNVSFMSRNEGINLLPRIRAEFRLALYNAQTSIVSMYLESPAVSLHTAFDKQMSTFNRSHWRMPPLNRK